MGREAELSQLHGWLAKALHGERQMVFIAGEAGIGKTTVVEAFLERLEIGDWRLASSPQASSLKPPVSSVWLGRGQCVEHYGPGEPYMPVLEALGRLCRGADGQRLVALLSQYAPTWLVQMPALLSASELSALQAKVRGATQTRMLREMAEAVDVLTNERPLLLILEDLQWSDYATVTLLSLLVRRREPSSSPDSRNVSSGGDSE